MSKIEKMKKEEKRERIKNQLPKEKALKNTGKLQDITGGHAQTMTIADCIH